MYHVVYLAYNNVLDLYYIGKKTFKDWSEFKKYNTSSSYKDFKLNILYKNILAYLDTSKEALEVEIYYQQLFKVKENPLFANLVYQTSTKFDASGYQFTEEQKQKVKNNSWPKCSINRQVNKKVSSFSKQDLEEIRQMLKEGVRQADIAAHFNVNQSTISRIKRRKRNAYS